MSPKGAIITPLAAEGHLRAALEHMDLLLASEQVEVGLTHLVGLLQHLRAFRQATA
jgi:hypothetical protein